MKKHTIIPNSRSFADTKQSANSSNQVVKLCPQDNLRNLLPLVDFEAPEDCRGQHDRHLWGSCALPIPIVRIAYAHENVDDEDRNRGSAD